MRVKKYLLSLTTIVPFLLSFGMVSFAGEWQKDDAGYKYLNNGSFITSAWYKTEHDGSWYHFNENGYMQTEWIFDQGKWYYLDANGGYLRTNLWIGNYYVGNDGAMLTDTTTPDGYRVGADGARQIINLNFTEQQKKWLNAAAETYLNIAGKQDIVEDIDYHGGAKTLYKNTSQMSDAQVLDYMSNLIQFNALGLSSEIKEVNYKGGGMVRTSAHPVSEIIAFTEGFTGKKVPGNFRELLYNRGFGISDTHIAPIMADGEGYNEVRFNEYEVKDGKLVARGSWRLCNSGGDVMEHGIINATFYVNADSILGMSLDFIRLSKS